ncbi:hypothetical protein D3C87_1648170 [compost metagenome]|jgi:hypothetical protein|uniref:hypothetical protein n=1 Tax=Edaphocola TaxID=2601681 RepID=UPI000FAE92A0|nr:MULTISPECIES: hypothetical protein [Edaphocola]
MNNSFDQLKKKLEVVKLEERLEMVQLVPSQSLEEGSNGCCSWTDSSCNPKEVVKPTPTTKG